MDSYNEILERMKNKYSELSGSEVPELSDIDIRMKVLAGEIYNDEVNLEFIKRQIFATTATGDYLDYHAADRGLTRKEAVKAKGEARFYVEIPVVSPILIPQGTVVSAGGANSVRFSTDEDAVINGGEYYISVPCTACIGGESGNIGANKIDTIVTSVVGVDGVQNLWAFKGGSEKESDEALRRRVLDTYKAVSNGTNKAYYKRLALSVDGVYSANVVPLVRGTGTVDVYIASRNAPATSALVSKVQAIMTAQRELNVSVEVSTADVQNVTVAVFVTLKDGYDLNTVRENIRASVSDYFDTLEVGDGVTEHPLSAAIIRAEGVEDFTFNPLYPSLVSVDNDTYAILNNVIVEEDSE